MALEQRLEEMLDAVLSSRRTVQKPAAALARCSPAQQTFALHWLDVIIRTNSEMGFQFISHAPRAFALLDLMAVEDWVIAAMDVYDRRGLYPGSEAFAAVENFAQQRQQRPFTASLNDVVATLHYYLQGLAGRTLHISPADSTYTNTEVLFLPASLTHYSSRVDNLALYRLSTAQLWAQTRYGTFKREAPDDSPLSEQLAHYPDTQRARYLFTALENTRLEACIRRDLPGLARQMDRLETDSTMAADNGWNRGIAPLQTGVASVKDTLAQLARFYGGPVNPPPLRPWWATFRFELAEATVEARSERERDQLQAQLAELLETLGSERERASARIEISQADDEPGAAEMILEINGEPVSPPAKCKALLQSLLLDFDEVPREFLRPAGGGGGDYDAKAVVPPQPESVWKNAYREPSTHYYDEWDFRRRHYRKRWCELRELDMRPDDASFARQTIEKYSGLVMELRRTFGALRTVDQRRRGQNTGDEIDLDALVQARADAATGREMTDQVFSRLHKMERDIAVIFMVDVSGSTKGWINDAERECLVLLCEALEILGDRYAIYGFSGMTRKRCELYRIKRMDEAYSDTVTARIAGIRPQDYTRMGVTIRHLTKLLTQTDARTRLLITLSDGKPDDYDGYRGEYGIEDTRQALIEAKRAGIHPFCITIDREARDYLPHMYGAVNYTLVEEVCQLPIKVSDIYRRLTT